MREILFRGKDKYSERWYEGFILNKNKDKIGYYNNCMSFNILEIKPETVGQFTGLTDKNGKKIFEGDIVKVVYIEKREYQGVKYNEEYDFIEEIVYYDEMGCFMLKCNLEGISMYRQLFDKHDLVKIKDIEVIGNIHDNKELLGE